MQRDHKKSFPIDNQEEPLYINEVHKVQRSSQKHLNTLMSLFKGQSTNNIASFFIYFHLQNMTGTFAEVKVTLIEIISSAVMMIRVRSEADNVPTDPNCRLSSSLLMGHKI